MQKPTEKPLKTMTVVIGLGTRQDVRMRTRLKNGILHNGQQPGSAGNSFFDYSEFEAMNSLSGLDAAHWMSINFVL